MSRDPVELAADMSLRDWFAGMVLQGLLADPTPSAAEDDDDCGPKEVIEDYAAVAYQYADAMLKQRENRP